jgi:hypothetical protein
MQSKDLKISVKYPDSPYIPPKIGQVCCNKISDYKNFITAEIINENSSVGLFKSLFEINSYDEKKYFMGKNSPFCNELNRILYLPPKNKYILVTYLNFPFLFEGFKSGPPFSTLLFSSRKIDNIKFHFINLKWMNFVNICLPQASIDNEQLIEMKGKHFLQFNITNNSNRLHSFQINVGFYNNNGKLIGGALADTYNIKPYKQKLMKIKLLFTPPPDCSYIIQPWPNTYFFNPFKKKKKK